MRPHHLAPHHQHRELSSDSTLHVVCVVSNPARFESRYRLARRFIEEMSRTRNVRLYVAEAAYGDRRHEVTESSIFRPESERHDHHHRHIQLRTQSEIWIKESMINVAVARLLPRDWRYVAWVDADVTFADPDWALETIHELQHFQIVQPWRHALDLGAEGEIMSTFESFGYCWQTKGLPKGDVSDYYSKLGHPGFAYACTRKFWEATGGLLDHAILGSGDRHMAYGAVGVAGKSLHKRLSAGYKRAVLDWQRRAVKACNGEVGYVSGHLSHHYHGAKLRRGYSSRWQILLDHGFDPEKDLTKDHQGLIQLVGKPRLEHAILKYNRSRSEDGG